MKLSLLKLFQLTKKAGQESIRMQNRLFLYWISMLLVVFTAIIMILGIAGVFSHTEDKVSHALELHHKNVFSEISEQFSILTAHGIALSEEISGVISGMYFNDHISSLNDSPEELKTLETIFYEDLNTVLRSSPCSGAYVIFEATTNTEAPNAYNSRAGLYLRFANLSGKSTVNQGIILFRGIADIARINGAELHNRWKLEFDVSNIPDYKSTVSFSGTRLVDGCFWTSVITLPGTWENVMLLKVPVLAPDGSVYGVCGVEVGELYFRLSHQAIQSDFGGMITVLAPIKDGELLVSEGMFGEIEGVYIRESENLLIKEGSNFNTYIGRDTAFAGIHQETDIRLEDGTKLYAVTLLPQEYYLKEESANRIVWGLGTTLFFLAALAASYVLAKNFVKPIVQSIESLHDENTDDFEKSGISEIDTILSLIGRKADPKGEKALPSDIEELFSEFAKRASTLTPTEKSIIKYYAEGKEVNEIPELCYISINTVRKHNANIYKKLGIGSKEELMLYVELFRRCGRLDKLL